MSQAKLRFSYGKNGNQAVPAYRTLSQLGDRPYLNGDASAPGYAPATLGNPDLKWETTLSGNVGLDLGLWSDRDHYLVEEGMTGSAEYVVGEWRYERIEGASHWMQLDAPERVNELLLEWFRA